MTDREILRIAMEQSAEDIGCRAEDFLKNEPVIVERRLGANARVYYKPPISANLVSYGSNVVASVQPRLKAIVHEYIHRYEYYHLFEAPNALWLNEQLAPLGHKLCYMAEYFLPDLEKLRPLPCRYELHLLGPEDFPPLYLPQWSNALCCDRKEYDRLAVGAYENGTLIALAGASADCKKMWQIGIDVLPGYRRQGVASALTSRLAVEILKRDKVPFYCCAWSNIPSARNAIRSGLVPAWVELTVKPAEFVDDLNKKS